MAGDLAQIVQLRGWATLKEACQLLNISRPVAKVLAREGKLQVIEVGKTKRVYLAEIYRYRRFGNFHPSQAVPMVGIGEPPGPEAVAAEEEYKRLEREAERPSSPSIDKEDQT